MKPEFLHSYVLDRKGGRSAVDVDDIADWTPEQGILWVHIDINNAASRDWLEEKSGLPVRVTEALLATETRPRSHVGHTGSLVVLRGVNLNPGDDPEDMVAVRLWIEPDRIFSTRRRKLLSVQDIRESLDEGEISAGIGDENL